MSREYRYTIWRDGDAWWSDASPKVPIVKRGETDSLDEAIEMAKEEVQSAYNSRVEVLDRDTGAHPYRWTLENGEEINE